MAAGDYTYTPPGEQAPSQHYNFSDVGSGQWNTYAPGAMAPVNEAQFNNEQNPVPPNPTQQTQAVQSYVGSALTGALSNQAQSAPAGVIGSAQPDHIVADYIGGPTGSDPNRVYAQSTPEYQAPIQQTPVDQTQPADQTQQRSDFLGSVRSTWANSGNSALVDAANMSDQDLLNYISANDLGLWGQQAKSYGGLGGGLTVEDNPTGIQMSDWTALPEQTQRALRGAYIGNGGVLDDLPTWMRGDGSTSDVGSLIGLPAGVWDTLHPSAKRLILDSWVNQGGNESDVAAIINSQRPTGARSGTARVAYGGVRGL